LRGPTSKGGEGRKKGRGGRKTEESGWRRREGRGGLSGNVAEEAFCLKSAPAVGRSSQWWINYGAHGAPVPGPLRLGGLK